MERKHQFKFKHLFGSIANWLLLPNFLFYRYFKFRSPQEFHNFDAAILQFRIYSLEYIAARSVEKEEKGERQTEERIEIHPLERRY